MMLERTVSALCYTVAEPVQAGLNSAVNFVLRQLDRMPAVTRLGVKALTIAVSVSSILVTGRPFYRLNYPERRALLVRAERCNLSLLNDLIRFYRTLTNFKLHEHR